jgi:hypothetical protein
MGCCVTIGARLIPYVMTFRHTVIIIAHLGKNAAYIWVQDLHLPSVTFGYSGLKEKGCCVTIGARLIPFGWSLINALI